MPSFIFRIDEIQERSEHLESLGTQGNWRPFKTSTICYRWAIRSCAVGAATVASLVINEYRDTVIAQQPGAEQDSSRTEPSSVLWSLFDPFSWSSDSEQSQPYRLPTIIREPGPVHLVVACIVYSIAMNVFYHTHKKDIYQLGIVACGALSVLAVGWASKQDTKNVISGLGPWAVMASLLLSAAFHRLLRGYGGEASWMRDRGADSAYETTKEGELG